MRLRRSVWLSILFPLFCLAQMTPEQKLADFNQLVGLYDKNYGPYEWKKTNAGLDLLDTRAWLAKVAATKDDLEFYDVCIEYVASLNDAHDVFTLPSDFSASLFFTVDLYDGKVLIDSITRSRLPASLYPFQIGDEVVSVDGKTAEELIQSYLKYAIAANTVSTRRSAAARIVSRFQSTNPFAHRVGITASVVIRRQSGAIETYTIPWYKNGTAIEKVGPVPNPGTTAAKQPAAAAATEPDYMTALRQLRNTRLPDERQAILNYGSRTPIFSLPQGFVLRLGSATSDAFYSGTYQSGGYRIGFIRIPSFFPSSFSAALSQFAREIAYFQENTDGLVVDDMRNPGGDVCYCEAVVSYLMPGPFRVLGFELRATRRWVNYFSVSVTAARNGGAPPDVVELFENLLAETQAAYSANRGRTNPLPVCDLTLVQDPPADSTGRLQSYSKPIILLADEFSASGGDAFAAMFQDNRRGPVFGMRTMGAGGSVADWRVGTYSEGATRVTVSLMNRRAPVVTADNKTAPYVENIGVRPDIAVDYMTLDNLLNGGKTYVDAFTAAVVDLIQKSREQQ